MRDKRKKPQRLLGWVPLGTLYGALLGHFAGMVGSTSQSPLYDRPIYVWYGTWTGVAIGLIAGLTVDWIDPNPRTRSGTPVFPELPRPMTVMTPLWNILVVLLVLYILLLPAFDKVRE